LLSPWPESVYAFDQMWSQLAEDTHLVAIDLPGFGKSQRRDAMMSPHAMGDFVVRVADEFGLEQPHLVGPDVGTGTALFAAANHPGRFRSLVVGSGASSVPITLEGPLRDWVLGPSGPVEIIAGRDESAVPPSNAEFLHDRLPHSKLDIIDAAHFTWEEGPTTYADLVTSWWSGGYREP
jgi:pimeloyl-ACP methyl ester carboxylesterase